ncbi:hypothetical protein RG959_20400 [Domibacillus sp. 8LH]|uniref:hypothetical protein n=1 Tax=Domibacillus sp. 8LH TaxID=3073900 RepID=UPI003178C9DC
MMKKKIALILIAALVMGISFIPSFNKPSAEAKAVGNGGHWIGTWPASQAG